MISWSSHRPPALDRNRELLDQAVPAVYKQVDGIDLQAWLFGFDGDADPDLLRRRPAIAFFHSSGWDQGSVSQFAPHAMFFAERGMVTALFDYRMRNRDGTTPLEAVADARSAVRWLRFFADTLGIDPQRIVAAGAAAGGHIAASAALLKEFDEPGEEATLSCRPDALVLFNPVLDVSKKGFGFDRFPDPKLAKRANPLRHLKRGLLPPTLIFHGTGDRVVPVNGSQAFARKARWRRCPCELVQFEGQGHGFWNFNVSPDHYEATVDTTERFLLEHRILP